MGLYSEILKRLNEQIEQGKLVIDKRQLVEDLDTSSVTHDQCLHIAVEKAFAGVMNKKEYRSVVHGEGYFVNYKSIDNPVYLHKIFENLKLDIGKRQNLAKALEQLRSKSLEEHPDYAQTYFDFDENGKVVFGEEMSVSDIVEMLEREAANE